MTDALFNTPNSIKRLRRYWKSRELPDAAGLSKELSAESDRSKIILCATILDDLLSYKISKGFVVKPDNQQFDYIFRPDGPLGSFSSRIEIAYLFGIIDDVIRSQLNDIREMRNACAHSKQYISFANGELANVAKRLFHPRGVIVLSKDSPQEISVGFQTAVIFLITELNSSSRQEAIDKMRDLIRENFPDALLP